MGFVVCASVSFWRFFPVELGSIVFNLLLDHPCYYHNAAKDEEVFFCKKLLNLAAFERRKKNEKRPKGMMLTKGSVAFRGLQKKLGR